MILKYGDVKKQSTTVFKQFGESKWKPNAFENCNLKIADDKKLQHTGIGKTMVIVAMGPSFEKQVDLLKKYRDKVDVTCCDKAFGMLLKQGIKADSVILADANIPFKWIEPYLNETKGVTLYAGAYSNPQWTYAWKGDIYFYVNKDAIETEKIFSPIFENKLPQIPAGSCVGNANLIFHCRAENKPLNYFGYEKYLLVGYDLGFTKDTNYYAFSNPKPKRYYMHHRTMLDGRGNIIFCSENLLFSNKWLCDYVNNFKLPVLNCSGFGCADMPCADFKTELEKINYDVNKIAKVKMAFMELKQAHKNIGYLENKFIKAKEVLNGNRRYSAGDSKKLCCNSA